MEHLQSYEDNLANRGQTVFPGIDGIPFQGDAIPDLKQEEVDQLDFNYSYKSGSFNLAEEKDKEIFEDIMSKVCHGEYTLNNIERRWVDNAPAPFIWLEWVELYRVIKKK